MTYTSDDDGDEVIPTTSPI